MTATVPLVPRDVATSVDELLSGASVRTPMRTGDAKSGAHFERVVLDGEPYVVKYLHVDDDWIMRMLGDLRGRHLRMWSSGLLDALPSCIDHAVVGAAAELGRNGWGTAILMRDVGTWLVPEGSGSVSLDQHLQFLDHMAQLHAAFWGWEDDVGLTPASQRWMAFGDAGITVEAARGFVDPVPKIAQDGWARFATRGSPAAAVVRELRTDLDPLTAALASTPQCLVHGDWKFGNLGTGSDGRTILLDWAVPGQAPATFELAWYLGINRERLPQTKEETIDAYRSALEGHGVATDGWWERQLGLCLLGELVQFGWEKVLGDEDELQWWEDRALDGSQWL